MLPGKNKSKSTIEANTDAVVMEAAPSYRYSVCEIPSGILCSHRKAISVEVTTKNARLSPNKMLNEMKGKLYSGVTRRGFAAGAVAEREGRRMV